MLDSIREIFDILDIKFESIGFNLIDYKNFEQLTDAIDNGKCPIADVLQNYLFMEFDQYSSDKNGSHAMVATGIKEKNGVKFIQLKNSYADDPSMQGKIHWFWTFKSLEIQNITLYVLVYFELFKDVHYLPYNKSMMDMFYIEFHFGGSPQNARRPKKRRIE